MKIKAPEILMGNQLGVLYLQCKSHGLKHERLNGYENVFEGWLRYYLLGLFFAVLFKHTK